MDTTPKYIKMCEGAYQDLWKYELKSADKLMTIWVQSANFDDRDSLHAMAHIIISPNVNEPLFPLFRQDQLQEMVSDCLVGLQTICSVIYEFSISAGEASGITIDGSMEQLWLAFVMQEKFNKIWDDKKEKWIKE